MKDGTAILLADFKPVGTTERSDKAHIALRSNRKRPLLRNGDHIPVLKWSILTIVFLWGDTSYERNRFFSVLLDIFCCYKQFDIRLLLA